MRRGAVVRWLPFVLVLAAAGCRGGAPRERSAVTARPIAEVLAAHTPALLAVPGVVGTGEGARDGWPLVVIYVKRRTPELERQLPATLEGFAVEIRETGEVRALH